MSETKRDDGGPAYPVTDISKCQCSGMTLRDYFAAAALTGLLSYVSADDWHDGRFKPRAAETYAQAADAIADAMLRQRDQP